MVPPHITDALSPTPRINRGNAPTIPQQLAAEKVRGMYFVVCAAGHSCSVTRWSNTKARTIVAVSCFLRSGWRGLSTTL
jgi:hypothetical protein